MYISVYGCGELGTEGLRNVKSMRIKGTGVLGWASQWV